MRCKLGPKKVARYARMTGLNVIAAFVRGNTDHRVDLFLADGRIASLYRDGTLAFEETWHKQQPEGAVTMGMEGHEGE